MRLIPRPAGGTVRRSSVLQLAGVLAGLAAARPAGTGPAPAPAAGPQPAPSQGGGR